MKQIDVAQNRPLWRLMSAVGATHSLWCLPHKKKKKKNIGCELAVFTMTYPYTHAPCVDRLMFVTEPTPVRYSHPTSDHRGHTLCSADHVDPCLSPVSL